VARAGLERITYLSGCYVGSEHTRDSEGETAKLGAERAIEASGVPFTIFKPTYFMETLPLHVQGPFGMVLGRQPHPLRMVAADDYARMVSAALRTPESSGLHLYVFGPEPLTISEALRIYCSHRRRRKARDHHAAARHEGDEPPLYGRCDEPRTGSDDGHAATW
jgi:uncharacterized protein YbjT (DUF2867 family)